MTAALDRVVAPDEAGIRRAVAILRAESVVAFPTETVYGLGANAFSAQAIGEVYRLKNRPSWNPLIVHVAGLSAARALAAEWPDLADELAARFWPGPLTLVVRRAAHLPGADNGTIASGCRPTRWRCGCSRRATCRWPHPARTGPRASRRPPPST